MFSFAPFDPPLEHSWLVCAESRTRSGRDTIDRTQTCETTLDFPTFPFPEASKQRAMDTTRRRNIAGSIVSLLTWAFQ